MPQLLKNNVSGVLAAELSAVGTSMTLVDATNFPSPGADYYLCTLAGLDSNGREDKWEIVRVTAKASNTLSITRAQEGTTNRLWPAASTVQMRLTAASVATLDGLATKEGTISSGTTAQYWRGDKSWRDLFTDVRAATLTGLSTATNAVITAADTMLAALGKLQAQVSAKIDATNGSALGLTLNGGYTEPPFAVTGATPVLSPANGSVQTWALTANSTPTAGAWASGQALTLFVDDGSARTINWASMAITWKTGGGTAPLLVSTGYTAIVLFKLGSVIYGWVSGDV